MPFFYASGSEFEEVFVGLGAKRLRALFAAAKEASPCIIFLDEIDALGGKRSQRDQSALKMTLNQLLTELDGFRPTDGVVVIGATNFPEALDPALVRPGRFDKKVIVPIPDLKGREDILQLYLSRVKADLRNIDISGLARATAGMTGADLSNLVNTAAVRASVQGKQTVTEDELHYAREKIAYGSERLSAVVPEEVRKITAYHEAGHAVVAILTDGAHTVRKLTVVPRGGALGYVESLPDEKQLLSQTHAEMIATIDVCLAGRAAEGVFFGEDRVTSGASSDLQKATDIATRMVRMFGMGSSLRFAPDSTELSQAARARYDEQIDAILDESNARVKALLSKNKRSLEKIANLVMEKESLTAEEMCKILGVAPPKAKEYTYKNRAVA